ncbi:Imm21 family immunity protein [Streptomyces sp. KL116D]|uniref:Imm21 family immunity protein n=1 Tax=Streptomyces sp. KL116D TaxID=3045152 RepID=UPI003556EF55
MESTGGPLAVVPVALAAWGGCTESGVLAGDATAPDGYDRACAVDGLAGVIPVGENGAQALVLAYESATSCYLPESRTFLRWLAVGRSGSAHGLRRSGFRLGHRVPRWRDARRVLRAGALSCGAQGWADCPQIFERWPRGPWPSGLRGVCLDRVGRFNAWASRHVPGLQGRSPR